MFVAFQNTTVELATVTSFHVRGSEIEFRLNSKGSSQAVVRFEEDAVAQKAYDSIVKALAAEPPARIVDLRELPVKP